MSEHAPPRRRWRWLIWGTVALLAAIILWAVLHHLFKKKPKPPPPNPVTIAVARMGAVPIILRGLGQVQAFNTYTARSRVDGNISKIGYREGSHVAKGDLLVEVDPRPYRAAVEQAVATRGRDQAQLENARLDLKRYAELLPEGLVTQQVYDTQRATVRQLVATVKADSAQIDQARLNLSYTQIRAPFSGRTGQRLVDIGNLVTASSQTALVVLTQMQPIFISFTLPELDLGRVVAALHQGNVEIDAFDSGDARQIARGTLVVLDNSVDPGSGTVRLRAKFANPDEALWPGEFVNAHIVTAVRQRAVTIPAAAVQMGPNGRFVFIIGRDHKVRVAPVEVAQLETDEALIDSGLRAGEHVVVDGAFGLSAGDVVQAKGLARSPGSAGALGMTGRTAMLPDLANAGNNRAPGKQQGQKQKQPLQLTETQAPRRTTPAGGEELNGNEGPGARTPLPNQRQVPEPPRDTSSKTNGEGGAGAH